MEHLLNLPAMKNVQHGFAAPGAVATTVRLSDRWGAVSPGDQLVLIQCPGSHRGECSPLGGCKTVGLARVLGRWDGPVVDIPPELMDIEHEESSRNIVGLMDSLERGYGEKVGGQTLCHVVIYQRSI